MPRTCHVVLNPTSGGGLGRRLRGEVERELEVRGIAFTLTETARRGHAVEIARAAAESGADVVVAAGGDGTIHEVANGILAAADSGRPAAALGVIPIGTGNDFAKLLEGGLDRGRAYEALAAARTVDFDVGAVEWEGGREYFVNGMGTGVDVEVVRQMERLPRLPGVVSYLAALVRAVLGFRAIPLRIALDGRADERRVMIIAIGNGPCLGGGFWVTPRARPDDGRFDVCIVDDLNYYRIARTIPRVMRGTHDGLPDVSLRTARVIELEAGGAQPLFFHLDGELREPAAARRLRVEVRPAALRVVGGKATSRSGPATPSAAVGSR